jgi:hypothetical protein
MKRTDFSVTNVPVFLFEFEMLEEGFVPTIRIPVDATRTLGALGSLAVWQVLSFLTTGSRFSVALDSR